MFSDRGSGVYTTFLERVLMFVLQTYTVEFNRDGSPLRGLIVGRLKKDGRRFLANHGDQNTLLQMAGGTVEIVGKTGWVKADTERKGRNWFTLDQKSRI